MVPLAEAMPQDTEYLVRQKMLELSTRLIQDQFLNIKDWVIKIIPTLISNRYGQNAFPIIPNSSLMGIEIGDQLLPVAKFQSIGNAIVLRDGNIHRVLSPSNELDMVSILFESEKDVNHHRTRFDPGYAYHLFSNSLIYESEHRQSQPYQDISKTLYRLKGGEQSALEIIHFWQIHHLDSKASLKDAQQYEKLLAEFYSKFLITFPPAK